MSNQKLKKQIIEWLSEKPYWLQHLGNHILGNGTITDELLDESYAFYREDEGLAPAERERPEIQFSEVVAPKEEGEELVHLEAIKNINFVNALVGGQAIKVGRQMTVIYGGNGAGKSGYIRLLNNAFNSRGDKEILPNVFEEDTGDEPECQFTFKRTEDPYDISFPTDRDHSEFGHFCVFDSRSVKAILDEENRLAFTPGGFDFFDTLIVAHDGIKARLAAEIDSRSQPHEFSELFVNDNDVQALILELGSATELAQVEKLATFGEVEQAQKTQTIQQLAELRALDKTQAIAALDQTRDQLNRFCLSINASSPLFSNEQIEAYRHAITEVNRFEGLAKAEGVESLQKYDIANIGSPEWTNFVRAGRAYIDTIESSYPSDGDKCIFCLQTLGAEHTELIHAYWDLLKGKAAAELETARSVVARMTQEIRAAEPIIFDESLALFDHVKGFNSDLAERWKKLAVDYEQAKGASINALEKLDTSPVPSEVAGLASEFDPCIAALAAQRKELINSNTAEEINKLARQLGFLEDRELLARIKDKVVTRINSEKWVALAGGKHGELITTGITRRQGALYDEHVTVEYIGSFNDECQALGAPAFVNLQQRNERASTLRKLTISDHKAIKVLSEGEQRAISLADFITEATLNPINRGVIFDDPVSSQDHERKEKIAERLVKLAKTRQVVVFTRHCFLLSAVRVSGPRRSRIGVQLYEESWWHPRRCGRRSTLACKKC